MDIETKVFAAMILAGVIAYGVAGPIGLACVALVFLVRKIK